MKKTMCGILFSVIILLALFQPSRSESEQTSGPVFNHGLPTMFEFEKDFIKSSGIFRILFPANGSWVDGLGRLLMVCVGLLLLFFFIYKKFEPLLLIPIAFGCILSNIPLAGLSEEGGILYYVYIIGIKTGIFPLLVFMGVGALTDFGPLIANPKTALQVLQQTERRRLTCYLFEWKLADRAKKTETSGHVQSAVACPHNIIELLFR